MIDLKRATLAILPEIQLWHDFKVWSPYSTPGISHALMECEKLNKLTLDVISGFVPEHKVNVTIAQPPPGHMTGTLQRANERTARDGSIVLLGPLSWIARGTWERHDEKSSMTYKPDIFLLPKVLDDKPMAWFVWSREHQFGAWSELNVDRVFAQTVVAEMTKEPKIRRKHSGDNSRCVICAPLRCLKYK